MKNEMDIMKMDERQKICWLLANRMTLFLVGIIWLGMIGWAFYKGQTPWFLIIAVPVIALIRFIAFQIYSKKSSNQALTQN